MSHEVCHAIVYKNNKSHQLMQWRCIHMDCQKIFYETKDQTIQYDKSVQKMINFDCVTKEDIKEHNSNWPEISNHTYRILIIGGSGSGKTNAFFKRLRLEDELDQIKSSNMP